MKFLYFIFLIFYSIIPPLVLYFSTKWIYKDKSKNGWHFLYIFKYLISFSFLPLLFLVDIDLGLRPVSSTSVILIILTFVLAILGFKHAVRKKVLQFYNGGIEASFMEEILYRGIIFGLAKSIFNNIWIALIISSIAFGVWHLKNFPWSGKESTWRQFFYTALFYGPVFCLERILTGDIYLSIFHHFLTDAAMALTPNWMRKKWLFPEDASFVKDIS